MTSLTKISIKILFIGCLLFFAFGVSGFLDRPAMAQEESAERSYERGKSFYKAGPHRYKDAQALLLKAVDSGRLDKEKLQDAYIILGSMELTYKPHAAPTMDNPEKAYEYFNRAVLTHPNEWSHYWRSKALNELGRTEEALADAGKAMEFKKWDGIFRLRALIYRDQGLYDQALKDIDEAIRLNPSRPAGLYYVKAQLNRLSGRYEEAFSNLRRAEREGLKDVFYHLERGRIFFVMGHQDRAIGEFARAAGFEPSFTDVFEARGLYYFMNGEYQLAVEDFFNYAKAAFNQQDGKNAEEYIALLKWFSVSGKNVKFPKLYSSNPRMNQKNPEEWLHDMKDSWTVRMIDYLDNKTDETTILAFPDRLPRATDRNRINGLTRYLVAQKRLMAGNEKGAVALLQSVVQSSPNRMIGALAEADIRKIKKLPRVAAKKLPPQIERELPLMARYGDEQRVKVWEWAIQPAFYDFPAFEQHNLFRGNLLAVKNGPRYDVVNSANAKLFSSLSTPTAINDAGIFWIEYKEHCDYLNEKKELVAQTRLKPCTSYNEEGIRVSQNGQQSVLVDNKDNVIARGDWFLDKKEGMWGLKDKDRDLWGYVNNKGEIITPPKFKGLAATDMGRFSEGYAAVSEDEKSYYFIDHTGKKLFDQPLFKNADAHFHNGFANIKIDDKKYKNRICALVDPEGHLLARQMFYQCRDMDSAGLAMVTTLEGKRGFVDRQGTWLTEAPGLSRPYQYDDLYVYEVKPDAATTLRGLVDSRGNVVLPAQFETIKGFGFNDGQRFTRQDAQALKKTPMLPVMADGQSRLWGYIRLKQ